MKRTALGVMAASAIAIAATGCGAETTTNDGGSAASVATEAANDDAAEAGAETGEDEYVDPDADLATEETADAEDDTSADEAADTGESSATVEYGQTYTSPKGIEVSVSKPTPYRPSEYAATDDGFSKYVLITVTYKNDSKKAIDGSMFEYEATSGDQPAEQVFDDERGVGEDGRTILPGRSLTQKLAFGYTPGQPLTLQISSYDDAFIDSMGPIVTYDGTP